MLRYCTRCGIREVVIEGDFCKSNKHRNERIRLRAMPEYVELAPSKTFSGDVGKVVEVFTCERTGEVKLLVKWSCGEECWVDQFGVYKDFGGGRRR